MKKIVAIRKPLLIVTILIQISISTYFNYYSFFLISSEVVVFILLPFLLPLLFIIFILIIRFISLRIELYRNNNRRLFQNFDENATFMGNEKHNLSHLNSVTQNNNLKKFITIFFFIILQDTSVTFLMIAANLPSPKDDYANALFYLLLIFTRLPLFLAFILFIWIGKNN